MYIVVNEINGEKQKPQYFKRNKDAQDWVDKQCLADRSLLCHIKEDTRSFKDGVYMIAVWDESWDYTWGKEFYECENLKEVQKTVEEIYLTFLKEISKTHTNDINKIEDIQKEYRKNTVFNIDGTGFEFTYDTATPRSIIYCVTKHRKIK
jgi:hypothetical protein